MNFGRKNMRWAAATLSLLALTLALAMPEAKGFVVATAAEVPDVAAGVDAAGAIVTEEVEAGKDVGAADVGTGGDEEDEGGADEEDERTPGATVQVLTDENFERITQVATGATTGDWFVEFYAPWCAHCRKLEGAWSELATNLGGQVNVAKVDVTKNKTLGKRFGIKGFPTLMMFSHGQVYKFTQARKLDVLMSYAKGGFRKTESVFVPNPPSVAGGVQDILATILKDIQGLTTKKMPSPTTIAALTMFVVVMMLLAAVLAPTNAQTKPKPKADTTDRLKKD